MLPPEPEREITMSEDCLFCRIATGETAATIVHRDDRVVAFEDIRPQAPTHLLIVPREHVACALDLKPEHAAVLGHMFQVAGNLARGAGLEDGFRLVVNNGPGAGQTVFHLHVHLLGGRAMRWPPG
jgi:histidine triad (HIT) family protein